MRSGTSCSRSSFFLLDRCPIPSKLHYHAENVARDCSDQEEQRITAYPSHCGQPAHCRYKSSEKDKRCNGYSPIVSRPESSESMVRLGLITLELKILVG